MPKDQKKGKNTSRQVEKNINKIYVQVSYYSQNFTRLSLTLLPPDPIRG